MKKGLSKTYRQRLLYQACENNDIDEFKKLFLTGLLPTCYQDCLQCSLFITKNFKVSTFLLSHVKQWDRNFMDRCICIAGFSFQYEPTFKDVIDYLSMHFSYTMETLFREWFRREFILRKRFYYWKPICYYLKRGYPPLSLSQWTGSFHVEYLPANHIVFSYETMIVFYSFFI